MTQISLIVAPIPYGVQEDHGTSGKNIVFHGWENDGVHPYERFGTDPYEAGFLKT